MTQELSDGVMATHQQIGEYQVPLDPMDLMQCDSCQ